MVRGIGLALAVLGSHLAVPLPATAQGGDPAPSGEVDRPGERALLAGLWDYNADESIDVLTGRTEQGPLSATQSGSRADLPTVTRRGGEGVGFGRGRSGDAPVGPTLAMMREARDLARDLLEVPETLQVDLGDGSVTIIDDLSRSWTYRTDGVEERQQIAASQFDVRTTWADNQLRQQIDSSVGFKMEQRYFVSADGQRLFVIVRIGEPDDEALQAGFDRVYDRITE